MSISNGKDFGKSSSKQNVKVNKYLINFHVENEITNW